MRRITQEMTTAQGAQHCLLYSKPALELTLSQDEADLQKLCCSSTLLRALDKTLLHEVCESI